MIPMSASLKHYCTRNIRQHSLQECIFDTQKTEKVYEHAHCWPVCLCVVQNYESLTETFEEKKRSYYGFPNCTLV